MDLVLAGRRGLRWDRGGVRMNEQSIEDISAEIDAEVAGDRSKVAALLPKYASSRDAEGVYKRDKDKHGAVIRAWLLREGGELVEEAADGTWVAYMQERRVPGRQCDFVALYKNDPRLFEQLVMTNCLRLDMASVTKAGALVAGINQYLAPEGKTEALQVEKRS